MLTLNDLIDILNTRDLDYKLNEKQNKIRLHGLIDDAIPMMLEIEYLKESNFNFKFAHFANLVNKEAYSDYLDIISTINDTKEESTLSLYVRNQILIAESNFELQSEKDFLQILGKQIRYLNSLYPKLMKAQWGSNQKKE